MIDTHCHLYLSQFDNDLENIIHSAVRGGVQYILVPGIDFATSKKSIELSQEYAENIFSAVGIHPNYSADSNPKLIRNLLISQRNRIFAIGEIGLDFYRDYSPREIQIEVFDRMIRLAKEFSLPICIHNRNADSEILKILDNWYSRTTTIQDSNSNGVFHSYNGSEIIAEWGMTHNFGFGISGSITYKRSDHLRNIIRKIGLDHLVLETDSPYLAPEPYRGQRNSPQYLSFIAKSLSNIFDVSFTEVIDKTDENASNLFGIK